MRNLKTLTTLILLAILSLPVTGCMPTMGQSFPVKQVRQIELEKTTMAQIRQMFGDPWRTGLEDGFRTWTYGEYTMKMTRDLIIRFDKQKVVKSYSFSSSYPEDENL